MSKSVVCVIPFSWVQLQPHVFFDEELFRKQQPSCPMALLNICKQNSLTRTTISLLDWETARKAHGSCPLSNFFVFSRKGGATGTTKFSSHIQGPGSYLLSVNITITITLTFSSELDETLLSSFFIPLVQAPPANLQPLEISSNKHSVSWHNIVIHFRTSIDCKKRFHRSSL